MTVALRIQLRESEIFILGNSQRTDSEMDLRKPQYSYFVLPERTSVKTCSRSEPAALIVSSRWP
jgi:hypothetical protein